MVEQSMSAREDILQRVRLGHTGREEDYAAIPRQYLTAGDAPPGEILDLFAERLHDYNAVVHRCPAAEIPATIAAALSARGKQGLLIPSGLPSAWLPPGFTFRTDQQLTYAELDQSEGVLTGCAVAVALTGTIVLHHLPENGRRALTLIPDYHLCVVFTDQVAATVPEGIRRMSRLQPPLLTTISGPSATSDIEMTRVKGVHGPRTLEVILASR
jgi:L-lactate dehydrogenase complex protein LldG